MHTLKEFNQLSKEQAVQELFKCCAAQHWIDQLMAFFPFSDERQLFDAARDIWYDKCSKTDYLEAFSHHPKIGDLNSLKEKFANTQAWAGNEQGAVAEAENIVLEDLARLNEAYYQKHGYIFIVCATGKSAVEMRDLLVYRMAHLLEEELMIAMGEQFKIILIRLRKLLKLEASFWTQVSQITTHVLDTSIGRPAANMCIRMKVKKEGQWQTMSMGITNADGRIADLLPAGKTLKAGHYQMCFDTASYFDQLDVQGFYPQVSIDFQTFDTEHYHVPLLINPFGYSTYRGS